MTADEIAYAGGKYRTNLPSPYAWYYTNVNGESITGSAPSWALSPFIWNGSSRVWGVYGSVYGSDGPGRLYSDGYVGRSVAVRPSVSLSSCNLISRGDGSPENPYVVYTGSGVCE
mgnify:FL=1